jgi:hypothetical protein
VCFEVMLELSCTHNDYITNFLHLKIELFGSSEDLRYKIHRELLLHGFVLVRDFLLDNQSPAGH